MRQMGELPFPNEEPAKEEPKSDADKLEKELDQFQASSTRAVKVLSRHLFAQPADYCCKRVHVTAPAG